MVKNKFGPVIAFIFISVFFAYQYIFASSSLWNFSTSSDYTFDSSKIEFSSGQAQLKPSSNWYNKSWTRRKAVSINNSSNSNTLANYQVQVTVAYDTDMQTDFDDIRFTDSDGVTPLNYSLDSKTDSTWKNAW